MMRTVFRCLALLLALVILCAGVSGCGTQSDASAEQAFHDHGPENTVLVGGQATVQIGPAPPARLVIPIIGINAPVELVGILSNGDLETPMSNPWTGVGWYSQGPRPGEQGSAVLDGHVDQPGGSLAIFGHLRDLRKGNEVQIVDSSGKTLHFQVTDVQYYTPQKAPLQAIFGNGGGKYLNLITCAGSWVPSQNQTTLRLVVYTILVS